MRSKEKVHTGSYTEVNPNLFLHKLEQYSDRGGYRLATGRPHEFRGVARGVGGGGPGVPVKNERSQFLSLKKHLVLIHSN